MLEPSSNPERVTPVKHNEYCAHDHLTQARSTSTPATVTVPSTETSTATTTQTAVTITRTRKPPASPLATQFLGTGRHPRTADREVTLRVLMHKTKISGHSNVDTDIADYDDHYLESLFAVRRKSGIIYLGPDLKVGTKNTRIGVPRELEGWMKTTLYRDNTTLRWILFEDRVAPRHQRQLLDGVDRCVCMLQPARTAIDGDSYMASCRTAMSRGQRREFESHARQMEQDDRFVNGVLTAQSCENVLHYDVEPNASSDIMIVSDIDLPSKPSSKYIVTSHSLQPESSAQSSPTSDSIFCTAHALLETCCHMKATLLILTIAYPIAWEVLFHVELCNVLHTLAEHGIDFVYHTPCRVSSQYNLPRDFHHSECRGDLTVCSTSSRIVQRTLDWGRHREWSFAPYTVLDVGNPSYWDALLPVFVEVMADRVASVAFPAEAAAEMRGERGSTLDDLGNDTMPVPPDEDLSKAVDREKDLLDAMPLPCTPVDEAERRRAWIAPPLRVRTATRRMHRQFGHPSSTVLVQILRAARARPEYIQACRHFRCDACEDNKPNINLPNWRFRKTTFSVGISASMFWKSRTLPMNLTCV